MCPTRKNKTVLRTLAMAACATLFWNCSTNTAEEAPTALLDDKTANVALHFVHIDVPLMDSIVVDCIGADSIHLKAGAKDARFDLDLFPHDHWKFKAELYANGEMMQKGEIEMKLEAGNTVDVSIPMHAVVGFVYLEIPLGFGNTAGIASGTLTLSSAQDSFSYPMSIEGVNAIFKSGMIPLGLDYAIKLTLCDSSGMAIYSMQDTIRIDESMPVPELQINSLRAKTKIKLSLADDVEYDIPLTLPAITRRPKEGDIVISEFLVTPSKNDSAAFEFVEIYNGSNDTLAVDNCYIGKSSALKESSPIKPIILPPREAIAIGSDTSTTTPEEFKLVETMPGFLKSTSSTNATIVFHCDGDVFDSLYYGKVDSLHLTRIPLGTGSTVSNSSQLNIGAWDDRENPENWCLGKPTPGTYSFCE